MKLRGIALEVAPHFYQSKERCVSGPEAGDFSERHLRFMAIGFLKMVGI